MWFAGHSAECVPYFRRSPRAASEAIIHADAQQTRLDAMIGAGQNERAVVQIEVEVFRSGGPVVGQRNLNSETAGPARAGVALGYAGAQVPGGQSSVGETDGS